MVGWLDQTLGVMNGKSFNRLPIQGRMLFVLFVCIACYALLELKGGFDFSSLAESTCKMLGMRDGPQAGSSAWVAGSLH